MNKRGCNVPLEHVVTVANKLLYKIRETELNAIKTAMDNGITHNHFINPFRGTPLVEFLATASCLSTYFLQSLQSLL